MISLRPATTEDITPAAQVLAAAYIDDEQDAYMFPGRAKHPDRYVKTKESIIRHAFGDETTSTTVAESDGKIIGVCIWYKDAGGGVEAEHTGWYSTLKPHLPSALQYAKDLLDPLVSAPNAHDMVTATQHPGSKIYRPFLEHRDKEACYGIMDIAVHPEWQRKGVAKKLVEEGVERAREEGLPIELSATPTGAFLYRAMGFEDVGVWRWKSSMLKGEGGWPILRWTPKS